MYTIFQLRHLSLHDQVQYVLYNGEFMHTIIEGDYVANLYWLGGFYAEMVLGEVDDEIAAVVFKEEPDNN